MSKRARLILVDDESDLTEALAEYLGDLGYDVETGTTIDALEQLLARSPADLVVLDLNLPGGRGGLDGLRHLRTHSNLPVLILSTEQSSLERTVGLELGADDFVTKPVEPQELAARIAGLLSRRQGAARRLIQFERASVDLSNSCLLRIGQPPERLGPGEVALLRVLAEQPERVLSRDELMERAPAETLDAGDRAIDTRIARLRRKLDTEAIITVRGRGYAFIPPARVG